MSARASQQALDRGHSVHSDLAKQILNDLDRGQAVRRKLPRGGRLFIDRPLPFLCVYRQPADADDPGTSRLVASEASFLIASGYSGHHRELSGFVGELAAGLAERLGSFLLLEIWSAGHDQLRKSSIADSPQPGFRLLADRGFGIDHTLDDLVSALGCVRILKHPAAVELIRTERIAPTGLHPLLSRARARRILCEVVGLEVQPVFRSQTGDVYPEVLRRLRRQLSTALRRGIHRFALTRTRQAPVSYQALGRRVVKKAVWEVDARLAEIARSYDFVFEVTPVNLERAWSMFRSGRFVRPPVLYYRPLPVDPLRLKRGLHQIRVDRIEDPVLADLLREKQLSLDRELTMLLDRGTRRFRLGSQQIYGPVDDGLYAVAKELLQRIRPRRRGRGREIGAEEFAARAREEIELYRSEFPRFNSKVSVRDDIYAGLMVSRGNLLIGARVAFHPSRVVALLSHEVGTHCLTFHNGRAQPFNLLAVGLPGYDELQEGLAVLGEYLTGGLDQERLRVLAGRVIAVHMMVQGASFVDVFDELHRSHRFTQKAAFTIVARVYRGGGLTKDAVYLRGLDRILGYLRKGGRLDPLFAGKIAARHVPIVEELQLRGVLRPVPVRPRYMGSELAVRRLARLRQGMTVLDLLEGESR
jgi:uncharacterized protein (TIGR02421 family)